MQIVINFNTLLLLYLVAKRVASRGGHRLKRKDIDVELCMPSRSTKQATALNKSDDNASKVMTYGIDNQSVNTETFSSNQIADTFDGTQKQILVEDIPPGVDDDTLDMCFSSKKLRSCSIDNIDFNEKEMNAVITFKSAEGKYMYKIFSMAF
ncbi:hypothetical protein DPMN_010772 [Dreissena polymorpha]|uniref:Uncharacterized protein n=1 Tax=Dreissena polymorpha TaxID=45954 RepID=A0A9D4N3S6_DREPO|nr:hypothetical protein DPMN_010772 [Dreissena polymorpha]